MSDQGPAGGACTGFWKIACNRRVVRRASRVAVLVGIVLAAINHGDRILGGEIDIASAFKILLTFCVPYSVSTYSSVLAVRDLAAHSRQAFS